MVSDNERALQMVEDDTQQTTQVVALDDAINQALLSQQSMPSDVTPQVEQHMEAAYTDQRSLPKLDEIIASARQEDGLVSDVFRKVKRESPDQKRVKSEEL